MFTYAGKFYSSSAHNEVPDDYLEDTEVRVEEVASLALLDLVGPVIVEQVKLTLVVSAATREFTLEIVLHSPDHGTLLRREMLASARRRIDSTLRPLLTELLGRVRLMRTALTYSTCDAAWGEVVSEVPAEPASVADEM